MTENLKQSQNKSRERTQARPKEAVNEHARKKDRHTRRHEFIVLAYGESPYLEACLRSLKKQTLPSPIRISTSTPNEWISQLADKYDVPVIVHSCQTRTPQALCRPEEQVLQPAPRKEDSFGGEGSGNEREEPESSGIIQDWNAALSLSQAEYVTLAHQDDVYAPTYTKHIMQAARRAKRQGESPQILFTDYFELRKGDNERGRYRKVYTNHNLNIKRLLLLPLRNPALRDKPMIKRLCLCLGNPICAPAVTYVKKKLPAPPFCGNMGSNIDWQLWEELSRQKGSFVYIPEPLCGHRIHTSSTTTQLIRSEERSREDLRMLRRFWPAGMAAVIETFYQKAEKSNTLRYR